MKKLTIIVLALILISMFATMAAAWPAKLTVKNLTGDKVYIKLSDKYYFVNKPGTTVWEVARAKYSSTVTACGGTVSGSINLLRNLTLTFVDCTYMWYPFDEEYGRVYSSRQGKFTRWAFWGEPGMEKPEWFYGSLYFFGANRYQLRRIMWQFLY